MRRLMLALGLAALLPFSALAQQVQPQLFDAVGNANAPQRQAIGATGIPAVNTEGTKTTYDASTSAAFAGATINDVCALPGSASKTIRALRVEFYMFATAASVATINISKRSAVNTGTAGTAVTAVPSDSANVAASAAPLRWTDSSAEVPGAAVGNVLSTAFLIGSASLVAQPVVVEFTKSNDQALVLRGVAQQVAVNLAGLATPAGSSFGCRFRWTEE